MKKALLLLAILGLGLAACGQKTPGSTGSTTPSGVPQGGPAAAEKAASATHESGAEGSDRADPTLERVAAMPEAGQLPGGRWKAGVHYRPIVPAQTTSAEPGQVEVLEVFWYGCSHCYALDPYLEGWSKSKPSYVKFVRMPVMWGPAHRAHGRLFYTLQALGKLDALHSVVFDDIQKRGNLLVDNDEGKTARLQLAFAKANGISEADFTREYNGFFVNSNLQRAEDLGRRYKVEGVPLVIINGKYETDVGMAGGQEQLIQLISDLSATEKKR